MRTTGGPPPVATSECAAPSLLPALPASKWPLRCAPPPTAAAPLPLPRHTIEDPALVELLAQTTDKKKKKKQNKKKAGGDGAKAEE